MKIYKVCGNYLKGIQEFEIQKINEDDTFIYEKEWLGKKRIICRDFRSRHPNDSNFFKTKKEAKDFVIEKITKSIEKNQNLIDKSRLVLNEL
jgi:hypothetical protein